MENKNLMSFAEFYASAHVIGLDDEIKGVVGNEIAGTRYEESHDQEGANAEYDEFLAEAILAAASHLSSIDEKLVMIPMAHHPVLISVPLSLTISVLQNENPDQDFRYNCELNDQEYPDGIGASYWTHHFVKRSANPRVGHIHLANLGAPVVEMDISPTIIYITDEGECKSVAIEKAKETLHIKGARRPMYFNLKDKAVTKRVVRHAARRVISQHQEEIEALAYK